MKLLRHFNIPALLILAISLLILKMGFLDIQKDIFQALNQWQYLMFILAAIFVAGAGIFINSVFGFGKDADPDISEAKGYNIYIGMNLTGIAIAYYLGNAVNYPMLLTGVFVAAAATMYIYATGLKQTIGVSNIIVAVLISLPVITVGLFQLYPVLGIVPQENRIVLSTLFSVLIDYTVFTFSIGLVLSLVNDLANSDIDYNNGLSTLPIALGRGRAAKITLGITIVPLAMAIYYANTYLTSLTYALAYELLFIVGLLVYFIIKLFAAKSVKDYAHLEGILKLVLLFTAFSIMVIAYNVNYVRH